MCQVATAKISNEHVHHSSLCLEGLEIGIKLIALHTRHTLATHHGGAAGCPIDRNINLHVEDVEAKGIDTDNESISSSDTSVALGGLDAEGKPDELLSSNQAKLTALAREINELCQ